MHAIYRSNKCALCGLHVQGNNVTCVNFAYLSKRSLVDVRGELWCQYSAVALTVERALHAEQKQCLLSMELRVVQRHVRAVRGRWRSPSTARYNLRHRSDVHLVFQLCGCLTVARAFVASTTDYPLPRKIHPVEKLPTDLVGWRLVWCLNGFVVSVDQGLWSL